MIRSHPLRRLLIALGMLAACLGTTSTSCVFGDSSDGKLGPAFVTELALRDASGQAANTFAPGERIDMVLTVRNRLNTAATVEFPSSRTSDFVVVRENSSSVVWLWSRGRSFAPGASELNFAAGEVKTTTVSWDQVDNAGLPVPVGTYEARGVLVFESFDADPLRSDPLGSTLQRFTIR